MSAYLPIYKKWYSFYRIIYTRATFFDKSKNKNKQKKRNVYDIVLNTPASFLIIG